MSPAAQARDVVRIPRAVHLTLGGFALAVLWVTMPVGIAVSLGLRIVQGPHVLALSWQERR